MAFAVGRGFSPASLQSAACSPQSVVRSSIERRVLRAAARPGGRSRSRRRDCDGRGARRAVGRRLAGLRPRHLQLALLAAHRHHARERQPAESRLDLSHRRHLRRQGPAPPQRLRDDAHRRRRDAVSDDRLQPRHRARSGQRRRALVLRSQNRAERRLWRRPHQPRRGDVARLDARHDVSVPPAGLRGDPRRPHHRARWRHRPAVH